MIVFLMILIVLLIRTFEYFNFSVTAVRMRSRLLWSQSLSRSVTWSQKR